MYQRDFTTAELAELQAMYAALPKGPWGDMTRVDGEKAGVAWDHFRYLFGRNETADAFARVLRECKDSDPFGKYFEPWPNHYYSPPMTAEEKKQKLEEYYQDLARRCNCTVEEAKASMARIAAIVDKRKT